MTGGVSSNHYAIASAELYDPATGTFASVGDMSIERMEHTATLLPDGKVLVAAGWYEDVADVYDPATRAFTPIGSTKTANRLTRTATLLATGQVLITASANASPGWSAELFDPATGTSARSGNMVAAQDQYTATLLDDGRVLVAGGCDTDRLATASAELFDPATGTFSPTGDMTVYAWFFQTATLLDNGTVLVLGGDEEGTARVYE